MTLPVDGTAPEDIRECRSCLKRMDSTSSACNIFQAWAPAWPGMEPTIANDLAKLARIEVLETDDHPKIICEPCYRKLLDASIFVNTVQFVDQQLRERYAHEVDKVWPKPIQVDKDINDEMFQVSIKQEILSDEELPLESSENVCLETDPETMEIKIEPEEIVEPVMLQIEGTMSLNPSCTGHSNSEEYVTSSLNSGSNSTDHNNLNITIKEEPPSEGEERDQTPDLSLVCMLCTKSFYSVSGLKAHVIAQHSYKSVKRKSGSTKSPVKRSKDEYRCQICQRLFTTSTDLMVHETCHNKHACYGCTRKFDTFKQLTKHRKKCNVLLSKTHSKPKTLDDVIRPVEKSNIKASQEDPNNDGNLHLVVNSAEINLDNSRVKGDMNESNLSNNIMNANEEWFANDPNSPKNDTFLPKIETVLTISETQPIVNEMAEVEIDIKNEIEALSDEYLAQM